MSDDNGGRRTQLHDLRLEAFASESGAPRARRSTDAIVAVVGLGLVVLTAWLSEGSSRLEQSLSNVAVALPDWVQWLAEMSYLMGALYILGVLVGVGLVARHRKDVLRDVFVAIVLTILTVILLTRLLDGTWPDVAVFESDRPAETYPAVFLAILTAVQGTAGPHFSRPLRHVGWFFVGLMTLAALTANITLLRDTSGALVTGVAVAAIVHLIFGSPGGRPSLGRIERALQGFGIEVTRCTYAAARSDSFTAVRTVAADGRRLEVKVYGRDAWNTQFLWKAWRFAWYWDSGPKLGMTRVQQVEHEALAVLMAERAGTSVPTIEAAGASAVGDALLVTVEAERSLADLAPEAVTDDLLMAVWSEAKKLHAARIVHGQLNATHIVVDDDGRPVLVDLELSEMNAPGEHRRAERTELLVSTIVLVGPDRALNAARSALGDKELAATLPYLQDAAVTPGLRRQTRHVGLKMKDIREQTAQLVGEDPPELERLRRVSVGSVLMTAVTAMAIYFVITALADIGWDTIVESLQGATWSLVLVALVLAQLTNAGGGLAVVGAAPRPIPLGIATTEQFAVGFINLAVPSTAARVAMNIRFFQKFGIGATAATTLGAITGVAGFVVQVALLLLILLGGNQTMDWAELRFDGAILRIAAIAVVVALVGVVVVLAIRRVRTFVVERIREPLKDFRGAFRVLRSPRNTLMILGGNLLSQLLFAAALGLCVRSVGGDVSYAELIWINTIVSLFAGLMPVPGGIGVTEAGLIAGLTSAGVDNSTAVAAVIVYRMCTYYLPPIWGWFAMRYLTRNDYL